MSLVRDGMLSDPAALPAQASAQEAAEHLVRPDVRAVLVVDGDGVLVGVVTPDALVERVVAAGRDPAATTLAAVAVEPTLVLDANLSLDEGYRRLEEAEVERAGHRGRPSRRRPLAVGRAAPANGGRAAS
jgi:CBS domain-containing protein